MTTFLFILSSLIAFCWVFCLLKHRGGKKERNRDKVGLLLHTSHRGGVGGLPVQISKNK